MTNTQFTEHPPVPQVLQEALKDYPPLLAELECRLQTVGRDPGMSKDQLTDQLERALWLLEGFFERYILDAEEALRQAQSGESHESVDTARAKEHTLKLHRRSGGDELMAFFGWRQH